MASAFAHSAVALTAGRVVGLHKRPVRLWVLGAVCSIVPDADVLTFAAGVHYADFWGHRGFTHSLVFAALLALMVTFAYFKEAGIGTTAWWSLCGYFFLCTASHGLLDAMTNGGLGVAFFAPFDNTRYFLPWRPIQVSPLGLRAFLGPWGLQVLANELITVGLPCASVITIAWLWRRLRPGSRTPAATSAGGGE